MSSTNSRPRPQPKTPVTSLCEECRRRKIKCDRISPACGQCIKISKACVIPEPRGNRGRPATSEQRQLLSNVKLQLEGEERQFISASDATSITNFTSFAPPSNPIRDLHGRFASLFSSIPTSWGSKRAASQLEVTGTRARRSNNTNAVVPGNSKRRMSDTGLITIVQAYSPERPKTQLKKRSDAHHFPESPATPRSGKQKHPSYKRLRASTRARRKSRKLADAEVDIIDCECGATEEGKEPEHWISCGECKVWQHSSCAKFLCKRCRLGVAQEQERSAATQTDIFVDNSMVQLRTKLEGAIDEIHSLRNQLAEQKVNVEEQSKTIADLKTENDLLFTARQERDRNHGWSFEDLLSNDIKARRDLKKQFQSRQSLEAFTKLSSTSHHRSTTGPLENGIRRVFWLIKQIFCHYENVTIPFIPSLHQHEMLRVLVYKTLGLHEPEADVLDEAGRQLSKLSIQAAMRALTGAAVREWVFEADLTIFEAERGLQYYRECLRDDHGAVTLRNWDLAALSKCVKSKEFREEFILQRAETLAIQLSNTLAPFFSDMENNLPLLDWDGFSTLGEGLEQWKDRRRRFVAVFTAALATKADLCLNIEDYELLSYIPGTKFDKTSMTVEAMDGSSDTTRNYKKRAVQLCVSAAFYIHPRGELSINATLAEAIVPMVNFISKDQNEIRPYKQPLLEAVVILSEDD
ncbi:hypothetical protein V502_00034 [Pseudogymnoascus sp. VKM F-4520 (FW-2644)]|nr:hypothetical protein V502_00034 [Pseudogymnoascus sp. VKM F-4520 (FW-2644)]